MNEIHARGPIVCSIATDQAIMYNYRSGVYDGANSTEVDHNVEVVGWGVQDDKPFWCALRNLICKLVCQRERCFEAVRKWRRTTSSVWLELPLRLLRIHTQMTA